MTRLGDGQGQEVWRRIRENRWPGYWWLVALLGIGVLAVLAFLFFRTATWALVILFVLLIGYQIADQIRHERD